MEIFKIKSKYILKLIFSHLKESIFLKIIKYNKRIQRKLEIKLSDFKNYSELYSEIIIDIWPNGKPIKKFINIDEEKYSGNFNLYMYMKKIN